MWQVGAHSFGEQGRCAHIGVVLVVQVAGLRLVHAPPPPGPHVVLVHVLCARRTWSQSSFSTRTQARRLCQSGALERRSAAQECCVKSLTDPR